MSSKRIILGIDPGLADLGWGIISDINDKLTLLDYASIKTKSHTDLIDRLVIIYDELKKVIQKYQPTDVAIEELFFGKNAKTAMMVGEARGVVMLLFAQYNYQPVEFKPSEVKIALTGYGNADKKQVQTMVQRILKLKTIPKPDDAADALAVALTLIFSNTKLLNKK